MSKTYDWHKYLELLVAEREKYKKDFMSKDWEKSRVAIIISNAVLGEKRHVEEIIRALERK